MAGTPFLYQPWTKSARYWVNTQNWKCAEFERDYVTCAKRFDANEARKHCKDFLEDLVECRTHRKQNARYYKLNEERQKQNRPYIAPPPDDIIIVPNDLN